MPIIETAVAKCDVCGRESDVRTDLIHPKTPIGWSWVTSEIGTEPPFAVARLVCPAHAIQVTHNGDVVTLVKGAE